MREREPTKRKTSVHNSHSSQWLRSQIVFIYAKATLSWQEERLNPAYALARKGSKVEL
jgi:hypothetical protein